MSQIRVVEIANILSNPYRNKIIYPLNPIQVDRLKQSMIESGKNDKDKSIWTPLPARKSPTEPNKFEIVWGHHRLEAANQLGFGSIRLEIKDYSDDEMISTMIEENATQSSSDGLNRVVATMDAVAAVARRIVYAVLRHSEVAQIQATSPRIHEALANRSAFTQTKNAILLGKPVGWSIVQSYLKTSSLSKPEIIDALANLNATGYFIQMLKNLSELVASELLEEQRLAEEARIAEEARLRAEHEHQLLQALEDKKEKKRLEALEVKRQEAVAKIIAARKEKEIEEAKKLEELSKQPVDPNFHPEIPGLIQNPHAVNRFRQIVTTEANKPLFPLTRQFELAQEITNKTKNKPSAVDVETELNIYIVQSRNNIITHKKAELNQRCRMQAEKVLKTAENLIGSLMKLKEILEEGAILQDEHFISKLKNSIAHAESEAKKIGTFDPVFIEHEPNVVAYISQY